MINRFVFQRMFYVQMLFIACCYSLWFFVQIKKEHFLSLYSVPKLNQLHKSLHVNFVKKTHNKTILLWNIYSGKSMSFFLGFMATEANLIRNVNFCFVADGASNFVA